MYTTERRRMSLHDQRRKDPVRVSAGSLWQDASAVDPSGAGKPLTSPRSRTRAVSVAYIVNEDASEPRGEENLTVDCLKEACADAHALFKTISFERISLGATDILDSFYNAGKWGPLDHPSSIHFTRTNPNPSPPLPQMWPWWR